MIQRSQNLYLLLAIICLVVSVFLTLGTYSFDLKDQIKGEVVITPKFESLQNTTYDADNENLNIEELKNLEAGRFFPLVSINGVLVILLLMTIFKFKNLESQYKFNQISLLISALVLILLMVGLFVIPGVFEDEVYSTFILDTNNVEKNLVGEFSPGISYYLYFAAVSFIFLASTGIKKDIKLLKSIDRIR